MMSLRRFSVYFVAVTACGVTAFPHWTPVRPAASDEAAHSAAYYTALGATYEADVRSAASRHHAHPSPARLAARN